MGFYFRDIAIDSDHLASYIAKSYKFLWIRGAHEIHENLNPTEIINHIRYSRSFLLTVGEEDGN